MKEEGKFVILLNIKFRSIIRGDFMCIYGVVNIDMVNSRKLSNRPKVQDDLKEYIKSANLDYRDYLLAPITVTLGDEWQIVLKDPSNSYKFIELFQNFLRIMKLTFMLELE